MARHMGRVLAAATAVRGISVGITVAVTMSVTAALRIARTWCGGMTGWGHNAVAPHLTATLIVANEVFLLVNGGSAGAVSADINVARFSIRSGFGLLCGTKKCDGCDGYSYDCVFHILSVTCVTLASTKSSNIYSEIFSRFFILQNRAL
jgi:hypothetical protein